MTTGMMKSSMLALLCLFARRPFAARALVDDAASAVQVALLAKDHLLAEGSGALLRSRDDCAGQVGMNLQREVVTSNLGGFGPTDGPPVIHIRKFVNLMNGQTADLFITNLTEYEPNNPDNNALSGEFNNINMKAGSVDLLFTFKDTTTLAPVMMPPFNLTIYDLDGPKRDVHAEAVAISTDDLTGYELTPSTDVVVDTTATMTEFGSSAFGEGCDNPTSIARRSRSRFLVIPRGSTEEQALLYVLAKVDPLGELCSGLLYVSSLRFTGLWVGDVGGLEFSTSLRGPMGVEQAVEIKTGAGAASSLKISEFRQSIPESLAEITEFQPTEPRDLNQHVDTLLVKLKLGPTIAKVRVVYQKEKSGFSNSLWLTTSGMRHVQQEIGGILGLDDHSFAASSPKTCSEGSGEGASSFVGSRIYHRSIHAAASFEDEDSGES